MKKFTKVLSAIMLMLPMILAVECAPENNDADVKVTTYTPQDVTQTMAVCGGDVIVTQGLTLNELGGSFSQFLSGVLEEGGLCQGELSSTKGMITATTAEAIGNLTTGQFLQQTNLLLQSHRLNQQQKVELKSMPLKQFVSTCVV